MITAEDVIAPIGEVEPTTFTGDGIDLETRMEAYISDAYALLASETDEAKKDRLARYHVYYRAFNAAAQQLAAIISGRAGEINYNVLASQVNMFRERAAEYKRLFTEGVTPPPVDIVGSSGGVAVPTEVTW